MLGRAIARHEQRDRIHPKRAGERLKRRNGDVALAAFNTSASASWDKP
jgi:hypothetical protein